MNIHECGRCDGCGHVTGTYQWEIAWTRWAPTASQQNDQSVLRPRPCPDCGGTGALLELDRPQPRLKLASRRGLRPLNAYANHVRIVLQTQGIRD